VYQVTICSRNNNLVLGLRYSGIQCSVVLKACSAFIVEGQWSVIPWCCRQNISLKREELLSVSSKTSVLCNIAVRAPDFASVVVLPLAHPLAVNIVLAVCLHLSLPSESSLSPFPSCVISYFCIRYSLNYCFNCNFGLSLAIFICFMFKLFSGFYLHS
jgi:hypothetical protein